VFRGGDVDGQAAADRGKRDDCDRQQGANFHEFEPFTGGGGVVSAS
jgi:hypothetical protein